MVRGGPSIALSRIEKNRRNITNMEVFQNVIGIIIFVIVIFSYVHIIHQFKRSEDLEIYELDYSTNGHLQEICDVKQPVLFQFLVEGCDNITPEYVAKNYGSYDCKLKDTNDYWADESVDYVVFPFQTANKLLKNDAGAHYYTENNESFVEESGLAKTVEEVDVFLKPRFCLQTKYDLITGSAGTGLPLRYHMNYRYFLMVTSGKITVKMTPWKSRKYLHTIKDYDTFEFRSLVNVWKPQKQYASEMEKLRFLEFDVTAGNILYVPAYWYYTFKFSENTMVTAITYNTVMNVVSHSPYWGLYYLQQQNIKKKMAKTLDLEQFETKEKGEEDGKDAIKTHMEQDHNIVVNVL
jgi:hypothetical protein